MPDPLTAGGLARFSATAAAHVGDGTVPGLVALVARGGQVHVEALGSLSAGGPPVRPDSLFRIASVTKPVTGAATLALVREGLLSLDEPVGRLLPELAAPRVLRRMDGPLGDTVPARRPVTVRDLLTFTFGFGETAEMFSAERPWPVMARAGELHLATLGPPDPAGQPDPDTWIAGLGSLPLLAQPGERWFYNTAASVLTCTAAGRAWSGSPTGSPAIRVTRRTWRRRRSPAPTRPGRGSPQGTSVLGWTGGPPRVVYGTASAAVDHVVISLAEGRRIRVRAVAAGEQKFFGFALGQGQRASRWQAYDQARGEVAASWVGTLA